MSFDYKAKGKAVDIRALKRVFGLVSGYRLTVLAAFLLTLAVSALNPLIPYLVQRTIDGPIAAGNSQQLTIDVLIIVGVSLLLGVVSYSQTFSTNWLGQQAIYFLRDKVFRHILRMKLKIYDRTPIGTMLTRVVSDIETVADIFSEGLIAILGDLLQIVIILGFMFFIDWRLTLISLAVFPVLLVAAYFFKEAVKRSFQDVRTQVARLNAFLQEHITGMFIVQVFNRQKEELGRFKKINRSHRDANIRSIFAYSVFFPVIEVLSAISIALIVWGGAPGIMEGRITIGVLIAFISYINLLFRPIRQVADKFNTLQMGMVAADRVFQVLDIDEQIPDTGIKNTDTLKGKVEFRNVWFAYEAENWVLKDVSFVVQPGELLAIVGHTGAGKSSITSLINRLYTYQKGSILLDDIPIEEYDLKELRQAVAVVLQDIFLFSDNIRNNIRLFNPAITDEEMEKAAAMVKADTFINKLPGGFDYQVQERGATLSTGQRQIISFIRAVLQNPKILILDEATSSVDQETEDMIQTATEKLLSGRTSIAIAHRLSTIRDASRILVLDKGCIKETGTHEELLAKNGLYKQLYNLQFAELVL